MFIVFDGRFCSKLVTLNVSEMLTCNVMFDPEFILTFILAEFCVAAPAHMYFKDAKAKENERKNTRRRMKMCFIFFFFFFILDKKPKKKFYFPFSEVGKEEDFGSEKRKI